MGYDIQLVRGKSRAKINARLGDIPVGSTYRMGDVNEPVTEHDLSFSITYNYSWYFHQTVDKKDGIRAIYGMKGKDARKLLEKALPLLNDMIEKETRTGNALYDMNYWNANARNAKKAVEGLINLCLIAPTFTFTGD